MTREAKIGMLTGLGVIVLIGVLLSEYLGDGRGPTTAMASTSGGPTRPQQMAPLPIGSAYRQQVMDPVGVPSMARRTRRQADVEAEVRRLRPAWAWCRRRLRRRMPRLW